jgi:hypothetical protein
MLKEKLLPAYCASPPPSIGNASPVMVAAASPHRNEVSERRGKPGLRRALPRATA